MTNYMNFPPHRPRIHCSIDVLYHAGALVVTHLAGVGRALRR